MSEVHTSRERVASTPEATKRDFALLIKKWPEEFKSSMFQFIEDAKAKLDLQCETTETHGREGMDLNRAEFKSVYSFPLAEFRGDIAIRGRDDAPFLLDLLRNASSEENEEIIRLVKKMRAYKESSTFREKFKKWEEENADYENGNIDMNEANWFVSEDMAAHLNELLQNSKIDWLAGSEHSFLKRGEEETKEGDDERCRKKMLYGALEALSKYSWEYTGYGRDSLNRKFFASEDVRWYRAHEIEKHPINLNELRKVLK